MPGRGCPVCPAGRLFSDFSERGWEVRVLGCRRLVCRAGLLFFGWLGRDWCCGWLARFAVVRLAGGCSGGGRGLAAAGLGRGGCEEGVVCRRWGTGGVGCCAVGRGFPVWFGRGVGAGRRFCLVPAGGWGRWLSEGRDARFGCGGFRSVRSALSGRGWCCGWLARFAVARFAGGCWGRGLGATGFGRGGCDERVVCCRCGTGGVGRYARRDGFSRFGPGEGWVRGGEAGFAGGCWGGGGARFGCGGFW